MVKIKEFTKKSKIKGKDLTFLLLSGALPATLFGTEIKQERPNILWLTFEDTSDYELSCYGHPVNKTPVIDGLAENGLQFMNAYSNGPQSSPSRSTIITGCYAPTYMMDWHRLEVTTPQNIYFPQLMRNAGYFCTNNQKTDYNSRNNDKACWDECSNNATYNSPARKKDQPFFAVFNCMATHMSRLTSTHLEGRRNFAEENLDPATLPLPPHVPDLKEIRSDYAFHLEGVSDVDKWVNIFINDLKEKKLFDNTIIFIFSDHGGCLPRGKGFSYESSYKVPLVVYIPPKWQHLSKMPIGKNHRFVAFVDLAPTVLSLAGMKAPKSMHGLPFLGKYDTTERKYNYGFTCNQASHYTPIRTITDGRFKYIRRYIPYKPDNLLNAFQWRMPSNLYWDKTYFEDKCSNPVCELPYVRNEAELFYDLSTDPFEINNLMGDTKYAEKINELRMELSAHIRNTGDLGFALLSTRRDRDKCFYDIVHTPGYDLEEKYRLMELTATVAPKDIPFLIKKLNSRDPETRFWSVINLGVLAKGGNLPTAPIELVRIMQQSNNSQIASESAYALCYTDKRNEAFEYFATHTQNLTSLEVLSMDKNLNLILPDKIKEKIRNKAIENKNETSIMARKILVNLGELPAEKLYGNEEKEFADGLKLNKNRRPLVPTPN